MYINIITGLFLIVGVLILCGKLAAYEDNMLYIIISGISGIIGGYTIAQLFI